MLQNDHIYRYAVSYFKSLLDTFNSYVATPEKSYYLYLANFLSSCFRSFSFIINPSGNYVPDIVVTSKNYIIGYIEVVPLETDFSSIHDEKRVKDFVVMFDNLILTNLFTFELFQNRRRIDAVTIGNLNTFLKGNLPAVKNIDKFNSIMQNFLSKKLSQVKSKDGYIHTSISAEAVEDLRWLEEIVFGGSRKGSKKAIISKAIKYLKEKFDKGEVDINDIKKELGK